MKWLIGEISGLVLIASLIGLLVGWLISHFLRSRTVSRTSNRYEGALYERDREISRLRSDLNHESRGRSRAEAELRRPRQANGAAESRSGVTAGSSRTSTVVKTAKGDMSSVKRPALESSGKVNTTVKRPALGQPGKYSVAAKELKGDSASLRVRSDASQAGKLSADDEAYRKIKALAELGERDRQLQYTYSQTGATSVSTSNSKNIDQYQKLLAQKNTQVNDLQRKVRELLASQSKTPEPVGISSVRERQLLSNVEQENLMRRSVRSPAGVKRSESCHWSRM